MTDYAEFLDRVIDESAGAAKRDYSRPEQRAKLEGCLEGFEACRGKCPGELAETLKEAARRTEEARRRFHLGEISVDEYWRVRCRESEIGWVCNVVSVLLMRAGGPVIVPPTARAAITAAAILGVEEK